jgi:hypothetical protein
MTQVQQMEFVFQELKLDGDKFKNILKAINTSVNSIDVDAYGITEDLQYVVDIDLR